MAMCVFGMASVPKASRPVKPILDTAAVKTVVPAYYQEVMTPDNGKTIIPLGPKMPYVESPFRKMARANAQYDAYEGSAADPTLPGEGQYKTEAFPNSLGGDDVSGYRWYLGDTFDYPNSIHHVNRFRTAGVAADNIDFLFRVNSTSTSVASIEFFTYNDSFNEISNPTAPTSPTTVPAAGNTGVIYTFATPLTAGTYRMNPDTSTLNSGAGFTMPTGTDGWYQVVFANATSPSLVYATSVQPEWWGTQGNNPGLAGRWSFSDGNGSTGSQGTTYVFDWGSSVYGLATAGTVTRGTTIGSAVNVANLTGTAGSSVQVTQALQSLLSRNNAEITVTCNVPATYATANLNVLKVMLVAKANATPLASSTFSVSLLNNTSGSYDAVYSAPAKNSNFPGGTDGDWIQTISPVWSGNTTFLAGPSGNLATIPNYVNGSNNVNVRVGVKQLLPSLLGWKLTVNLLYVDADQYGPENFSPSICFATNRG